MTAAIFSGCVPGIVLLGFWTVLMLAIAVFRKSIMDGLANVLPFRHLRRDTEVGKFAERWSFLVASLLCAALGIFGIVSVSISEC